MTLLGLVLVLLGMGIGLTAEHAFNGQWLLGLIMAAVGVALAWKDRTLK